MQRIDLFLFSHCYVRLIQLSVVYRSAADHIQYLIPSSHHRHGQVKTAEGRYDLERSTSAGKYTAVLTLDISAALDVVYHTTVCSRSESDFGICGTALRWLQSIASDRSQYISIGLQRSAVTTLSSGVPQGSILGPLLFAMYVSPTDDARAHQLQYHQYVDDLMLYTALTMPMSGDLSSVADCTDAVSTWFMEIALLLNGGKTEEVIFETRQRLASIDSTLRESPCSL